MRTLEIMTSYYEKKIARLEQRVKDLDRMEFLQGCLCLELKAGYENKKNIDITQKEVDDQFNKIYNVG